MRPPVGALAFLDLSDGMTQRLKLRMRRKKLASDNHLQ
jgi:hypothetical protein